MGVIVDIKKRHGTMVDAYGNQTTKEDYFATKDRAMGLNVGRAGQTNSLPKSPEEKESDKKE